MVSRFILGICILCIGKSFAQNDLDAIRYSRLGNGGSSRNIAMGGAFASLGADVSCSSTNPAGLGLYTKGEMQFSAGLRFTHNTGKINGKENRVDDANFTFNSFGMAMVLRDKGQSDRHILAFSNNQLVNFSNSSQILSYTNNNSIVKDMMNKAIGKNVNDLDFSYEGAAFNVYLIDTLNANYISFVDLKRTVLQSREIKTAGKINDLNFSYAYALDDQYYFGLSLGIPKISYTSTTTHTEFDDKDSMQIVITNTATQAFTSTYIDGIDAYYPDKLGFNSLTYTEFFTTNGSGINLKAGVTARVNDHFRFSVYMHSPTLYNLRDVYYFSLAATFDADKKNPIETKYPENGGTYTYKIITPPRYGFSSGITIGKKMAMGVDYELIDYRKAKLSSSNVSDFAGVNAVIESKYSIGHNFKLGVEYNLKPVMIRGGYFMQGSPFGAAFVGKFVRHTGSLGFGFRTRSDFYFDFAWLKSITQEDYVFFSTITQNASIKFDNSMLCATIGLKF
ncbi:MAG: hypothetical protein IPM51_10965 [Sphingobacteriaceae bacterium]|nr:hypothetical protein [Sphingobacteriaceae bacterium]